MTTVPASTQVERAPVALQPEAVPKPVPTTPALTWDLKALGFVAVLLDAYLLVLVSGVAAESADQPLTMELAAPLVVLGAIAIARLVVRGVVGLRATTFDRLDTVREVVVSVGVGLVCALATAAVLRTGYGGVRTALMTAGMGAGLMSAWHVLVTVARDRLCARRGLGTRTLIIGAGTIAARLERRLLNRPTLGLRPVGFLEDEAPRPESLPTRRRKPVLGRLADLERVVAEHDVHHVVVAFASRPDEEILPLVGRAQQLGLEVSLVPRLFEVVNDRRRTEQFGPLPLLRLRHTDPSSAPFAVKHFLSRTLAGLALLALAPLLGLIALAVRLSSPGPVLFRQERVGRDGQVFTMLKFRSMRVAPSKKAKAVALARLEAGQAPGGVEGDDRRTRLGTFLRRSSLDELPQLVNVLLGHMDLVGPRPERPEIVAVLEPTVRRYEDRHRVKSGLTGWAQINGLRGNTSLEERVEWDNWYINNWSLWLDFKILLWTPLAVLRTPVE